MFRQISLDTFREPSFDVIQLTGFTCFNKTNSLFVIHIYLLADDLIMWNNKWRKARYPSLDKPIISFSLLSILFHNTPIHTQLKEDMGIMIDQRPKPSWNSLALAGAVSGETRAIGWEGWPFPSPRFAGKLSVSGVDSPLAIYNTAVT